MKGILFKSLNFGDVVQAQEMNYWQPGKNRSPKQPLKSGSKIVILTKVSVCPLTEQEVAVGTFVRRGKRSPRWVSTQCLGVEYNENGFVLKDTKLVPFTDLSKSIQRQIRAMPRQRSWVYLKGK